MDTTILPEKRRNAGALLSDIIHARMTGHVKDLLLLAIDTGIAYGMGMPLERHPDPITDALIQDLLRLWHAQNAAARGSAGDADAIDAPEWLREQQALAEQAVGARHG